MGYFCQNFNFVKETIQIAYGIFVTKTNLFRLFDLNDFQLGTKMWNFPKTSITPIPVFFFFFTQIQKDGGGGQKKYWTTECTLFNQFPLMTQHIYMYNNLCYRSLTDPPG
jgi:hypothetical protein